VDTPSRGYFLCVYRRGADRAGVLREHGVLQALAGVGLPYEVPAPLRASSGETLVALPGGEGLAGLFDLIPGQAPDRANRRHLHAVGEALGHLHRALAGIDAGAFGDGRVTYGMLDRIHASVPDPLAAADDLPLASGARRRIRAILASVIEAVPGLYATLPGQLCHCDYGPGNTLVVGERVSGVLDFEFAGPDLRAIDVATGWYWGQSLAAEDPWTPIEAFAAGYGSVVAPTAAELAAAPMLARLQRATGLVHWVGRLRDGEADPGLVLDQAQRLLAVDAFVAAHGDRLIETLAGAS
jgi:homoserine kinase type II